MSDSTGLIVALHKRILETKQKMCTSDVAVVASQFSAVANPLSRPQVGRIWLWVYSNKIPVYPIFYLFQGDSKSKQP